MKTTTTAFMLVRMTDVSRRLNPFYPLMASVLLLSAALSPSNAHAQTQAESSTLPTELAAELRQLQAKFSKHESFRVKFSQQVFSALRKKTTKSEGELVFSRPLRFRWEITAPNRELYVNNGEWFWKYVEATKHALRLPASSGDLDFLDVIFAIDKLQSKYSTQKTTQLTGIDGKSAVVCPSEHTCLKLEPLQKGSQKSIELAIDRSNGFVSIARIDFKNGNRTLISFSEFKNAKVAANSFEFNPPAGTAVDKR